MNKSQSSSRHLATGEAMSVELIALLHEQAALREHNEFELARGVGMTYGELSYLIKYPVEFIKLSASRLRPIAHYLGISTITVWVLIGKLNANELTFSAQSSVELATDLDSLVNDESVSVFLPWQVLKAPSTVQALLWGLYQTKVSGAKAVDCLRQLANQISKEV